MPPSHQSPQLYSLFLYLNSLRVFQPLGTVHVQKEVLQQGLCFLQVPGILLLELKGLVLLVIAAILETREDREKKPGWATETSHHSPGPVQKVQMLNGLTTEEPWCKGAAGERLPSLAACFSICPTQATSMGQAGCLWVCWEARGCAAVGETALAVGSMRH